MDVRRERARMTHLTSLEGAYAAGAQRRARFRCRRCGTEAGCDVGEELRLSVWCDADTKGGGNHRWVRVV